MWNHHPRPTLLVLCLALASCASEPGLGLGDPCSVDDDCESGICSDAESTSGSYCSNACTIVDDCVSETDFLSCDAEAGFCFRPCSSGETRGSGASTEICVSGHFVGCATQSAPGVCTTCGCEPFGGGTCIEGAGCFVPQPDGSACTRDAECASGACHRDTDVCGPPREVGEPCSVDAECSTQNCSTDGDQTMVGHCNQVLGSSCTAPMTGRNVTATCNNCQIRFGDSSGYCLRPACDPMDANHCPSFAGHEFRCERSVEGTYHCYELCELDYDDCYYDTVSCGRAGDYCR